MLLGFIAIYRILSFGSRLNFPLIILLFQAYSALAATVLRSKGQAEFYILIYLIYLLLWLQILQFCWVSFGFCLFWFGFCLFCFVVVVVFWWGYSWGFFDLLLVFLCVCLVLVVGFCLLVLVLVQFGLFIVKVLSKGNRKACYPKHLNQLSWTDLNILSRQYAIWTNYQY